MKIWLAVSMFFFTSFTSFTNFTYAAEYKEGIDYFVVDQPAPEKANSVVEFYNFACAYCFRAEAAVPAIRAALPKHLDFERVAVVLGKGERFRTAAQVAYVAEAAGLMEQYHDYIFQLSRAPVRWELQKYNRLSSLEDAKRFFNDVGVSEQQFEQYLQAAQPQMKADEAFAKQLSLMGTPSFLVKGRYVVSGLKSIPYSERRMADLVLYLANLPEGRP